MIRQSFERISDALRLRAHGRRFGMALAGVAAAALLLGLAMPAGAKSTVTAQAPGVKVTIKAGPVKFVGISNFGFRFGNVQFGSFQTRPRFTTSVGHFIVGQASGQQRRFILPGGTTYGGMAYGCPPSGAPSWSGGYGVPLYDYRARGYGRPSYGGYGRPRYGYGGYGAAPIIAAPQPAPAPAETLGTFNLPKGYVTTGRTETPRPSFQPRIVQIAATTAPSGPMPVVHKPAGKNHIHIE